MQSAGSVRYCIAAFITRSRTHESGNHTLVPRHYRKDA